MLPYFNTSGIVAIEHISRHFKEYAIGDVVVCTSPMKPGRNVLKRIIGMVNICIKKKREKRKKSI